MQKILDFLSSSVQNVIVQVVITLVVGVLVAFFQKFRKEYSTNILKGLQAIFYMLAIFAIINFYINHAARKTTINRDNAAEIVRHWLDRTGHLSIRKLDTKDAFFDYDVTQENGLNFQVLQHSKLPDRLDISSFFRLTDEQYQTFQGWNIEKKREFSRDLSMEAARMEIEFIMDLSAKRLFLLHHVIPISDSLGELEFNEATVKILGAAYVIREKANIHFGH